MSNVLRWLAGGTALALAMAGCGGGGGDVASAVPAERTAEPVAAFAESQESVSASPAVPSGSPGSDNLVTNGAFDGGTTGWVDWGHVTVVSDPVGAATPALAVGPAAGGVGQEVPGIVPGNTYRLTARARAGASSETLYVGVNFIDASGAPLTQNSVLVNGTESKSASLEVVAPSNAVRALVYVWKNGGSGPGYVDDLALASMGPAAAIVPSSSNLVADGGFESGLSAWEAWSAAGTSIAAAAVGSRAAQVGTGAGGFGQDVQGIVPGNSYRVSALAKVGSAEETGYLGVLFMDDAGTGLQAQNVVFRSTTYATVQADVTAPANATRAKVFIWKNAGDGFAYVDEVALVR